MILKEYTIVRTIITLPNTASPLYFIFNGVHEDYHQPGDEVSKINFPLLAKRAQLVFHTAWDIANRDQRPIVDIKNDMPQSR